MSRGSKAKYTAEQKRKARHIEESYEQSGVPGQEAAALAWATVNKQSGGGEKTGGSGLRTSAAAKKTARSDSAKRAAQTRAGLPRHSRASLETQTKASLVKEARSEGIAGRSRMTKAQLIEALSRHR